MSERIDAQQTAARLKKADKVLIISHKNPDGDTLGSAGVLYWALVQMGKTAAVLCSDPIHEHYDFMGFEQFHNQFEPEYIVAVDLAGQQLFGEKSSAYAERVNLCIDHHGSNSGYAEYMLLDETAAATCEIMFDVIELLGVSIDKKMANCLYSGVSTDTGCFRFANTTARSHRVAAYLMDLGAEAAKLNELFFDTKSKGRIAAEQIALASLEYHFDDKCALICLTREQLQTVGTADSDLEGVTSIPRSIEGVLVGITMRQNPDSSYKISVRTKDNIDAADICRAFGGGGHKLAAGCELMGSLENVKQAMLVQVRQVLEARGA